MSSPSLKTYLGACHCQAFKFRITVPEIKSATSCNCSLCSKKGYLWIFPPKKDLEILTGDLDTLTGYQYGEKSMTHKFCPTCGTGVLIERYAPEFSDGISLNVRTLQGVNPFTLEIKNFDGASRNQPYTPPSFTGTLPTLLSPDYKIYIGGCHCGAVTLAVATKPLPQTQVKEDNCSICVRHANTMIYPHTNSVSISLTGQTQEYLFGRSFNGHVFCTTCGVPVYMKLHGPPAAAMATFSEARKAMVAEKLAIVPVRVRVLNGVEWEEVKVEREDEGTEGWVLE